MGQEVTVTTGDLLAVIRAYRQLGTSDLDDQLADVHLAVARNIAARAKAIAIATGNRGTAKAAQSIVPKRSERGAQIVQGSNAKGDEWMLGALFGAYHDQQRLLPSGRKVLGWNQFPRVKEGGYSVYPAIEQESDRTTAIYADAVERIIGKAMA